MANSTLNWNKEAHAKRRKLDVLNLQGKCSLFEFIKRSARKESNLEGR